MDARTPHRVTPMTRRDWLLNAGAGFGGLALGDLLARDLSAGTEATPTPASGAAPWRRPATARSVIFLFMEGGPSHIDTFDPKPEVNRLAGRPLPSSFKPVITPMGEGRAPLLASRRKWKQHGQSGLWVSDWLPHIATCADELAVIRSCWSDGINHSSGVCQMNTGSTLAGRPSLGSWVSYGLGTENANLPAFIVMQDVPRAQVAGGPRNWGTGFMPAVYQGTRTRRRSRSRSPTCRRPRTWARTGSRRKVEFLGRLNRRHQQTRFGLSRSSTPASAGYELAFRMQAEAPEAIDIASETALTRSLYGLDDPATEATGRLCLLSRRLVERGVRFVQIYCGAGSKWDSHSEIETNHAKACRAMDQPVAGLLKDLKRRGLLDQTLVVWGGEFGRTPMSEKGNGRDHNPYGFTMWMAGGGVKEGIVVGKTDDLGLHAIEDRLHVHDIHATILHALGVDHARLIYRHQGRPERPTVNEGRVYERTSSAPERRILLTAAAAQSDIPTPTASPGEPDDAAIPVLDPRLDDRHHGPGRRIRRVADAVADLGQRLVLTGRPWRYHDRDPGGRGQTRRPTGVLDRVRRLRLGVLPFRPLSDRLPTHVHHQLVTTTVLDLASPYIVDNQYLLRTYMQAINPPSAPESPTPWQVWNLPDIHNPGGADLGYRLCEAACAAASAPPDRPRGLVPGARLRRGRGCAIPFHRPPTVCRAAESARKSCQGCPASFPRGPQVNGISGTFLKLDAVPVENTGVAETRDLRGASPFLDDGAPGECLTPRVARSRARQDTRAGEDHFPVVRTAWARMLGGLFCLGLVLDDRPRPGARRRPQAAPPRCAPTLLATPAADDPTVARPDECHRRRVPRRSTPTCGRARVDAAGRRWSAAGARPRADKPCRRCAPLPTRGAQANPPRGTTHPAGRACGSRRRQPPGRRPDSRGRGGPLSPRTDRPPTSRRRSSSTVTAS